MMTAAQFIGDVERSFNAVRSAGESPLRISRIDYEADEGSMWVGERYAGTGGSFRIEAWSFDRDARGLALDPVRKVGRINAVMVYSILRDDMDTSGLSVREHVEALMSGVDPRLIGEAVRHEIDNSMISSLFEGAA